MFFEILRRALDLGHHEGEELEGIQSPDEGDDSSDKNQLFFLFQFTI